MKQVRLEIRRGQKLKAEGEDVGARTRVKVVKNKLAPPFGLVSSCLGSSRSVHADDASSTHSPRAVPK